jgi:hypothetical protein
MLPIRWVADAAMIIRRHRAALDWDLLAERARSRTLSLPMLDALTYLRAHHQLEIPDAALDRLRASPESSITRVAHRIRSGREGAYLSQLEGWRVGWRSYRTLPFLRKLTGFMTYYASMRGQQHAWQAPFRMALNLTRLFARIVRPPSA